MAKAVEFATLKAAYLGAKSGILAVGINGYPARSGFTSWINVAGITEPITYITSTSEIDSVDFTQYKVCARAWAPRHCID